MPCTGLKIETEGSDRESPAQCLAAKYGGVFLESNGCNKNENEKDSGGGKAE